MALRNRAGAPAAPMTQRYMAAVNKSDVNMGRLTMFLNQQWDNGWRLAHILEQHGNTVMIFERRDDATPADNNASVVPQP